MTWELRIQMQTEEEARQKYKVHKISDISPAVKVLQPQRAENQVTGCQYKGDQATGNHRGVKVQEAKLSANRT